MDFTCICKDPEKIDSNFPADSVDLVIPSRGSRLFGVMYRPQGRGPHKTVILLHGFPGYEKNLDLAQMFRRAGFNTVVFHYRGSWGSEGNYSFHHVLEDTNEVIEYFYSEAVAEKLLIDRENIILAGHSMGGFSALLSGFASERIKNIISIAGYNLGAVAENYRKDSNFARKTEEMFEGCAVPLKGTNPDALLEEIQKKGIDWDLSRIKLPTDKKVFLIAGARDSVAEPEIHHYPLYDSLSGGTGNERSVRQIVLDGCHSFSSKRIELAETILGWLADQGLIHE